jgi:hypothetical protein
MAKRRTSGVQRRSRASDEALNRRIDSRRSSTIDWRIVALVGLLVAGVVVGIIAVLIAGSGPSANIGQAEPDDGRSHIAIGTIPSPRPYSSTPGTSGPHWETPANWGVYADPQPEAHLIHNLEHGGIVIWYQPRKVDQQQIQQLTDYVNTQVSSERYKFILAPWGGQDFGHPIAVTAWRWLLYLDSANLDAIRDFATAHYGQAPEPLGGPGPPA